MSNNVMSMEAALDEERISVLALLEGNVQHGAQGQRGSASSTGSGRASSPFATPRSPVRSMLDIAEDPAPRHASIASTNGGITPAKPSPIRSMLDIGAPPPPKVLRSAQTSPIEPQNPHGGSLNHALHQRSKSDAASASRPADFGPRIPADRVPRTNLTSQYQFSGILSSASGVPSAPKRNTLAGKKLGPGAMAETVSGSDLGGYGGLDRDRNHSIATTGIGLSAHSKSRSPSNRLSMRSNSPHANLLSANAAAINGRSNIFALDSGTVVDMNSAYRRLSDANLAFSGGSLAVLSTKGQRMRADSGDGTSGEGSRLVKDYSYIDDDAAVESSDEDRSHSSDEERIRGRKARKDDAEIDDPESATVGMGRAKGNRQVLSLMAAAEEERQEIAKLQAKKYKVRSLLEPEITVTGPGGDRLKPTKPGVHPTNAFDQGGVSGITTPLDSDTEADISDIKRAQKLSVVMTPITSTPETSRCVRTIYRGDFAAMQQEAVENHRRVRNYLVATDLSDEAAHALEWTVGTVLRDGDTLLAIYCVDEETGISRPDGEGTSVPDAAALQAQAAIIAAAASRTPSQAGLGATLVHTPSPLGGGANSARTSPMGRTTSHAEQERHKAVHDITDRVTKLLRKTRLQVRVVIEVIHCKSPKHLICEVIDYISPTLVILGSRGRSALKGVILGSFSNYLVTKSSVPVMGARKRLRKHSKYKRPIVRLANNLASGGSLTTARVDEFVR